MKRLLAAQVYMYIIILDVHNQAMNSMLYLIFVFGLLSPGNLTNEDDTGGWQNGPCSIPHQIHPSP